MNHPLVGHVHLKVSDLDRSIKFYQDVLGLELTQRYGPSAAFLSWGGYHHHVGLNVWQSRGGSPPDPRSTGLFHVAFLYPNRRSLANALRRVIEAGVELTGAADHGVSEAIYFNDPDQNGIEIYYDRNPDQWPHDAEGMIAMVSEPLDLQELLRDAD